MDGIGGLLRAFGRTTKGAPAGHHRRIHQSRRNRDPAEQKLMTGERRPAGPPMSADPYRGQQMHR